MFDSDKLSIRILSDIDNAFQQDPLIEEYGIIPVQEPVANKSPLVLVDHRLGVEGWCVRNLYLHAYNKLIAWRKSSTMYLETNVLLSLTRVVLLINPECATVWNIRKELTEKGDTDMSHELNLGKLILTQHAKSPESFRHRKWLLQRLKSQKLPHALLPDDDVATRRTGASTPSVVPFDVIHEELRVCTAAANRYPCNYSAWCHRAWVVRHLALCHPQVLAEDLETTKHWVMSHVSDHSGFHYRQFLIDQLAQSNTERVKPGLESDVSRVHSEPLISTHSKTDGCLINSEPKSDMHRIASDLKSDESRMPTDLQLDMHQMTSDLHSDELRINTDLDSDMHQVAPISQPLNSDLNKQYAYGSDLLNEQNLVTSLIVHFPEHQALWYHRRYCVYTRFLTFDPSLQSPDALHTSTKASKRTKVDHFTTLMKAEHDWLKEMRTLTVSKHVSSLLSSHDKWMQLFISTPS